MSSVSSSLRKWLPRKRTILRWLGFSVIAIACCWWVLPWCVPLPERLSQPLPTSPLFLAADGTPLRQLLSEDGQRNLEPVDRQALPPFLIHATLAAEDHRFYHHGGIDLIAVARAAWDNLSSSRVVSGASTLTQQLVKISAPERARRSVLTKIKEALQARRLEMTWDKERILTEYLNRVGYGNLLTGCASASHGYFNKPLRDLTPAECAFLAALPQSPARLNPFRNSDLVERRQDKILHLMASHGWLTSEQLNLALAEPAVLQRWTGGFDAPHATHLLGTSSTDSGPIRTTIEKALQQRVESIITRRLGTLTGKHVTQAAAVVIENKTGRVLALAGSRDFFSSEGGQLNGAWVPHSPGSALKPFTYLLALEHGYTPASILPDLPIEYATPTGIYRPENYDKQFYGPVTLRDALGNSLNIPAVRVLRQLGGESVLCDALRALGISTLTDKPEHYGLGLTIGNAPVRLLELANAYACLARLGEWKPWTLVQPDSTANSPSERKHTPEACYLIADILKDPQARMLTFGPHTVIRLPFPCAVKTGTSTSYRDNWTMGFTPEYTVGVWAGNFDNTPMNQVSGVTGAGPIFRDIMVYLHEKRGTTWYAEPSGIQRVRIDPRLGRRLDATSPQVRVSRDEIFVRPALPPLATKNDYDAEGRALLPTEYARWITGADHWLAGMVALRPPGSSTSPPSITSPADNSIFYLDPDLQDNGSSLLLRASGGGESLTWSSHTLTITTRNGQSYVQLLAGNHEIQVQDPATGSHALVRIEVREPKRKSPLPSP